MSADAKLEEERKSLGFSQIGKANGVPLYVSTERANASESKKRLLKPKLRFATHQLMLSALGSDSALRGKFNDNGKSDYSFWIAGIGKDTNHLIDEAIEAEITPAQEAEAIRLSESGMNYRDVAKKLGVTALRVYYALKKKGKTKPKKSIKPRSSGLCSFDKKGNLVAGKGGSLESTVRVSRGSDDLPLLFFVLRDSYSRIGGARFVITACNGRQVRPDTLARVILGTPQQD